ncbi:NADH:ubiquinone oxidoreductase subunit N [Dyella jiangningensis]|uniref:NADH-quinone oxidoreductase subunit NuoN n=1 Tax=Dyella jiangningensis TaxID=1379159 RepID=UPI000456710F|nr:NADH-quinone oxidoreductase subunit NuoN [Dyella jiangningensis]AHX12788.1 NADH:ubiquinone oxidoreductase subunit N [Dyella jiangningensis]MDG2537693.1 NADH-quinone oxidoreductase subunit NuoN [Dyella jiangningensis]
MPNFNDILILLPELYLVAAACLLLLLDAFMKAEQRPLLHWLSIAVLLVAIYLVVGGQPSQPVTAFSGMFVRDGVAEILKVFALLATALVFVYAKPYLIDRKLFVGEFYTLSIFAVIGIMLLVSAGSLVTVYLGLEQLTLSSYALVALNRDSRLSSEAAIKYFVLGALASGMLLYGMSMVYGATGTLDLARLHMAATHTGMPHLLVFGLIFMIVGIAFKLGAAPFHMWIPDVYQGSPTAVTIFIGSAPKLAAFGMAYRLLASGLGDLSQHWQLMLACLAVLSLAIGNIVAIVQSNLKRLLAYSTISHMGYLLLGLVNAGPEGYAAALFYAISYALMGTAAFGVILALARAGFECEEIDDLKGLNQRSPWAAFLMMLVMFSLAGVPPLFGFFAKLLVLQAAIHAGFLWLAIVGAVFAIIGLYYYLRVVKVMYFDKPVEGTEVRLQGDVSVRLVLSLNVLALLVLGLAWGPLFGWCQRVFVG